TVISSDALADLGVIFAIAWIGSGDVRRFRPYIPILIGALVLNAAILLVSSVIVPLPTSRPESLGAGIVFAALAAVLGELLSRTKAIAPVLPWPTEKPILTEEQIGRAVLGILGVGSLVLAAGDTLTGI